MLIFYFRIVMTCLTLIFANKSNASSVKPVRLDMFRFRQFHNT